MSALAFGAASSDRDLEQILALQRRYAREHLGAEELAADGFLTVRHDFELLRDMNDAQAHVVAWAEGRVVAYALSMLRSFDERIPILKPMYAVLDELAFDGRPLRDLRYFIMGQVCVDKPYRGTGAFEGLYGKMRELYAPAYDLLITEVSRSNGRSIRAHAKVGFELLHRHPDPQGEEWDLIVWDWRPEAHP